MNFDLTEEQKMIQEMTRNFAEKEVMPKAAEIDQNHRYPEELVKQMAELGLMGIMVPTEYDGAGLDCISYVVAMEEISRGCASTGVIMSAHNSLAVAPIMQNGTEEQKERWLKPLARGEKLGCFCLSEPGTGSDAAAQRTVAVKKGDKWVLNGTKNFITNGPQADVSVLFAMTDKSKGVKGISCFVIDKDAPGYTVGKIEEKLGILGSGTSQMICEDLELGPENLLGEENQGFKIAMQTLDGGRVGIASQALGIARSALEEAIKYSQEREAFGQQIAKFQGLQWMMADMAMQLDAARLLTYRAASLKDKGARYSVEAAMAKLHASESAMFIANKSIQIHGGYGYVKEYNAERHFRDAKITEIYEGTSEIQRLVIASGIIR